MNRISRWSAQLGRMRAIVRRGGVIAYPTESCFGLGCDPRQPRAVQRILRLKGRPRHKGVILIGAGPAQLLPYADDTRLTPSMRELMRACWPGPCTLVLPAGRRCPAWIRGRHPGVALRHTAHPAASALCRASGMALVSTSANPAGRPAARSVAQVRRYFGAQLDGILIAPIGRHKAPSRIVDAASGLVLRGAG